MLRSILHKYSLPVFASAGGAAALLLLYQRAALALANRRGDSAPHTIYHTPDGVSVAYEKIGYGRPILLLHSLYPGASRREWRPQTETLAKEYRVYSVDLPGFGQSEKPLKPWTAYQYAQLLHHFITDVVKGPVALMAANGSADLALILSRLYPEDIKKLVLISPEGYLKSFATPQDTQPLKRLLSPVIGTQIFLRGTSKRNLRALAETLFYQKERMPADFVQNIQHNARYGKGAQAAYAAYRTRFAAADTKDAFAALTIPFLLIWGEKNVDHPASILEMAEDMQQTGQFLLFENTAALPHLENSKAFGQIAAEFLA